MTKFRVNCKAVPEGSTRGFIVTTKSGQQKAVITHNKSQSLYEVRNAIKTEYLNAGGLHYGDRAMEISVVFSFIRPKSVKENKRPFMTVKPDLDKILRSCLDALTKVAYDDDCQIVSVQCKKIYDVIEYIDIDIHPYGE